jgi:hypothetical protein
VQDDHPEKVERQRNVKLLEIAADVRKLEVTLFWQRSIFFWGFIAAAFVAFASLKDDLKLRFLVACFGIVCSLAWTLGNRGSKYWYEAWEQKVTDAQEAAIGIKLFTKVEPVRRSGWIWQARRYSVSKLAIALSDFTVLVWVFLASAASPGINICTWDMRSLGASGVTIAFVAAMLIAARSDPKPFEVSKQ